MPKSNGTSGSSAIANPKSSTEFTESDSNNTFSIVNASAMALTLEESYILTSIEGIVNRNQPRLYVLSGASSEEWLSVINSSQYSGSLISETKISDIINLYSSFFNGSIVFNCSDPTEVNIATPLCGIYNSLLVPSRIYNNLSSFISKNLPIKVNVTKDLSDSLTRFTKFQFALKNYYPMCNQTAIAMYDGTVPGYMRNYLIANNIFTLWRVLYVLGDRDANGHLANVPLDSDEELQFFEDFLDKLPGNIPVLGYMWPDGANEGAVMNRISAANKYLISLDWCQNLPFFNQMKLPDNYTFRQNRTLSQDQQDRGIENKIYISGIWSDGDNLQYIFNHMKSTLWDDPNNKRGEVPTGWTLNPSMIELSPYIMKYFYDTASINDYFIGGLSGKGYTKMDYYTDYEILTQFLEESQVLWDKADMSESRIWDVKTTGQLVTQTVRLNAIFDGYGGDLSYSTPRKLNGVPIIKSIGVYQDTLPVIDFIQNLQNQISVGPKFIFLHLHCWTCTTDIWTELANDLAAMDHVEVVRPDVLANLMKNTELFSSEINYLQVFVVSVALIVGLIGLISIRERV